MSKAAHKKNETEATSRALVWSGTIASVMAVAVSIVAFGLLAGLLAFVAGFGALMACVGAETRA